MSASAGRSAFGASLVLGLLVLAGAGLLQGTRPAPAVLPGSGRALPAAVSFIAKSPVPIRPHPSALAAGDFDRDGRMDLAVVDSSPHTVTILFGTGAGGFVSPRTARVPPAADSIAVADVDRDGQPDLIVGASAGRGSISVLIGKGEGAFARPHTYVLGGNAGTRNPGTLSVADLNGDQRPDIIAARGDKVLVLLGRGDGAFKPARSYLADGAGSVSSFAVGRTDGDRAPDVVAGSQEGVNAPVGTLSVLHGTGSGGFSTARRTRPDRLIPEKLALLDVSGDGKPDLLVACTAATTDQETGDQDHAVIVVSLGRGSGVFSRRVEYDVGTQAPTAFLVRDFNHDGRADLLLASTAGLTQLLGNGDGTFQAPRRVDATPRMGGALVVAADFDGDGRPDLAVAAMADDELSVFVNATGPTEASGVQPSALEL